MRQLLIQVPRGNGKKVLETAKKYEGANLALFEATGSEGLIDLAIAHVSNSKVEELLGELESLPQLHVTLIPQGVMALQPPPEEAP
ncbi:TIGR00341 family protein, partial [Chroococcidiopsis sp. CCALA 051]